MDRISCTRVVGAPTLSSAKGKRSRGTHRNGAKKTRYRVARRPAPWEGRPHDVSVGLRAGMRLVAQRPAYQVDELVAIVDT
jgi:hypothetical protein